MQNNRLWIKLMLVLLIAVKMVLMTPQWHNTADGQRLLIDTEEKYNWYNAWNECARYDAQLIVINSATKNQNLMKLLKTLNDKNKYLWIGGNGYCDKISFHWAPTEQEFTFTNWLTDASDQFMAKKQCVYVMRHRKNFPWNIVNCDDKEFGFICEEMNAAEDSSAKADLKGSVDLNKGGLMYNGSIYGLIG